MVIWSPFWFLIPSLYNRPEPIMLLKLPIMLMSIVPKQACYAQNIMLLIPEE